MRPVLRPSPSRVGWWARRLPLLRLLRLLLPRLLLPRLLPLLLLAHPGPAAAWGPGGHQAVGAIADQLIQGTAAAAQVRQLLGSSLQTASVWADCARAVQSNQGAWHYLIDPRRPRDECAHDEQRPGGQAALIDYVRRNASRCEGAHPPHSQCRHKAYHFTDLPIQHPAYAPGRPGTAPGDVVQTLNATLAVLSGAQAPAPHNIAGRAEALRLLVHFVGDLHQPLHVGAVYLSETGALLDPATPQALRDHGTGGGQAIRLQGRRLHESWDAVPAALYNQALAGGLQATGRTDGGLAQRLGHRIGHRRRPRLQGLALRRQGSGRRRQRLAGPGRRAGLRPVAPDPAAPTDRQGRRPTGANTAQTLALKRRRGQCVICH
jgi:hypothetical protein